MDVAARRVPGGARPQLPVWADDVPAARDPPGSHPRPSRWTRLRRGSRSSSLGLRRRAIAPLCRRRILVLQPEQRGSWRDLVRDHLGCRRRRRVRWKTASAPSRGIAGTVRRAAGRVARCGWVGPRLRARLSGRAIRGASDRRRRRCQRDRTTWLRAQTLDEPTRSRSLVLIRAYVDTALRLSNSVPGSPESARAAADGDADLQSLWALAGPALDRNPTASAQRLYVESLNEMIDMQTVRVSALNNRVPGAT